MKFWSLEVVFKVEGGFEVKKQELVNQYMNDYARYLSELSTFSLKIASVKPPEEPSQQTPESQPDRLSSTNEMY